VDRRGASTAWWQRCLADRGYVADCRGCGKPTSGVEPPGMPGREPGRYAAREAGSQVSGRCAGESGM